MEIPSGIMSLTTLEDYVRREIFKSDRELFDFCPACDETGNTIEALMKGLFQEAKKLQKERFQKMLLILREYG